VYVIPSLFLSLSSTLSDDSGAGKLADLVNIRTLSIVLSFCTFSWAICSIRNRAKGGAMQAIHLIILVLKIFFEATSRIIIFSCCLYVTNEGQFSSLKTLGFFYLKLAILMIFHFIFNRTAIFSVENLIGIILNAYNSIITFTSMNYVAIFQNIRKGHVSRRNEDYHESSLIKQLAYNIIILITYLTLTCYTFVKMEEFMPLIDVNGFKHTVSQKHVFDALIFAWILFVMGILCNIGYYKVHPSAVDLNPSDKWHTYILGRKWNLKTNECLKLEYDDDDDDDYNNENNDDKNNDDKNDSDSSEDKSNV